MQIQLYVAFLCSCSICLLVERAICYHLSSNLQHFQYQPVTVHQSLRKPVKQSFVRLNAKLSKKESETTTEELENKSVTIPLEGMLGGERGLRLFENPLEIYDPNPLKETDDIPGKDGTDDKAATILKRIEERVEKMKASGEWEEGDSYGKNPLKNIPTYKVMWMQLLAIKPFESWDDLALTYSLVVVTFLALAGYLLVLKEVFNSFMQWFLGVEVDNEFINAVMRNIVA